MTMYKPQERCEEISIKAEYSETVKFYYGKLKSKFTELEFEDVEHLMDEVYKDAYIDGFKDALFFTGRFFYNNYKTITRESSSLPEREIFPVF